MHIILWQINTESCFIIADPSPKYMQTKNNLRSISKNYQMQETADNDPIACNWTIKN